MAHPKRRQSSTRQAKRRTHDKAVAPTLAICPNCGEWHVYHTVCGACGYYRGTATHRASMFLFFIYYISLYTYQLPSGFSISVKGELFQWKVSGLSGYAGLYAGSIFRCFARLGTAFFIPSITHWAI